MTLNERLKRARKKAGKTQEAMASELGIGLGTIKRYEKDASKIPVSLVSKMALLCDVDEIWLFTGKKNQSETAVDKTEKTILEHQNIVKQFKDPERGLRMNQGLIEIEKLSEDVIRELDIYIRATLNTTRTLTDSDKQFLSANQSASNSTYSATSDRRTKPRPVQPEKGAARKSGTQDN